MTSFDESVWSSEQRDESLSPFVIYLSETTDPFNISDALFDNLTEVTTGTLIEPPPQPRLVNRALNARLATLWILFVSGVIGNTCALVWLWHRRHRKSRVLKIIFGLVTADLCVCFFVILFSTVYEMMSYHWLWGNISCKLMMFMQSAAIMASSYMLVLLALDRHMAVRSPMKGNYPTTRLVVLVWVIAAVLSLPQLRVWEVQKLDFNVCKTIFTSRDDPRRLVYLSYATLVTFCVPFVVTSVAYVRICKKIWDKARETRVDQTNKSASFKLVDEKGKVRLQRSGARTLQQAKGKTLRMSITIIAMFLLCGFPYFLVGILDSFTSVNKTLNAIFGIFAVSNSSLNPYIFLWFSQKKVVTARYSHCKRRCCRCFERKIEEPVDSLKVCSREKIVRASSGGLTQDSTTGSSTGSYQSPASKVTLTLTLSAQNYV
ncbi:putative gonadotropin-releasing hormone II receptor-like [Apostichopus japonicus]|uniref:Putative gonadotropin-releasing hormone II receptor-like n=1 Tax=Stichopus japonicus TaxID=307972 RepID=A0A2G8KB41_STIJA|nr:putative gonadotropin-releasing hormone II receptor-like [Apostichopus japonicus]